MKSLFLWMSGLLFLSLTGAQDLKRFPEHFVVAKKNDANPVTLTCRTNVEGDVTWTFQLEDVDIEENIQQNGLNLSVSAVDIPMLGKYSCWRGEEMLSSTYLLLESEELDYLSCRAKSYDCNFSCVWIDKRQTAVRLGQTAVRLGLGRECSEGGKTCDWVSSDQKDGRFQFELNHLLSPYTEESTQLEVTVEAIVELSVLRKTKRFYLRDIIEPDSPNIVRCQEGKEDLNVTIDAPSSWSTPHSYFSLEHQIEYVLKDDGKTGRSSSVLIPKRISKLRVRSRDAVVLSAWSQWTAWNNVITGKNKPCKCKNKAKTCCPELPSEYLENCKNRKGRKKGGKSVKKTLKYNA
ncbi:interleukin-12 subunit beta [Gymnodraco acuticeps]|uniref:Interleukin-12 subunit beta n=1 Tax=Gymnodraco acuticeps TaxID=8218 RepID=A0A6P8W5M1_GYMAC|nr:interleukin-12 subunit beta [Gymnodraco acuticeps]